MTYVTPYMRSFGTFLEHITNFNHTCGFPLESVYDSDVSNHVLEKHLLIFYPMFLLLYCYAGPTKNVGAILIKNED